ncbi:HAAS signaling domain-containing protein [Paenibacillus sp. IHBB 10380]|uniref:HAAS signaling domain-containing protein n=1 Tax=Paenibacillus sp. IHBB 10380 TaxID=1566358 RepID=UPI0005CFEA2B|nr:DUF1700 domain-containing protein [Paenibacillus sp. IHBB 10380]AJS58445.1 hypothetical protein UB51_07960 [Paenibacillus sp. IHBB 10380]
MNKEVYLAEIRKYLTILPKQEQDEILTDYEEHFEQARLRGRTESDTIQSFGEPHVIAKEILVQYEITKAQVNPSLNSVTRAVFAALGLGVLNLLFVLAPFILGLAVLVALFACSIFLLASPILLLIQDGFTFTYVKELFSIIGLVGIGLLILLGALKITTLYYKWMINYLKFNLRMVRRNES